MTKFIKYDVIQGKKNGYNLVGNRPWSWRAVNRQEDKELAAASQGKILDLKKFHKIFEIFFHFLTVSLLEYKLFY